MIISENILISTVKRSKGLTIFVEGPEDIVVYRKLVNFLMKKKGVSVSVKPTNTRTQILKIFDELKGTEYINKVIFLADQDVWVYKGVPEKYNDERIVLTSGYSIENDIVLDHDCCKLLIDDNNLRGSFDPMLDTYLRWYALALSRHLKNPQEPISSTPTKIMDAISRGENVLELRSDEVYPEDLFETIKSDFCRLLRGKSLTALLIYCVKQSQVSGAANCSFKEFFDKSPKDYQNSIIGQIFEKVENLVD